MKKNKNGEFNPKMPEEQSNNFNNGMYVLSYEYARDGATNAEIAALLGVHPNAYDIWVRNNEHLKAALEKGRARQDKIKERYKQQLEVYYERLKPASQAIWKEIFSVVSPDYSATQKAMAKVANDEQTLQHFYVGAYIASKGQHTKARKLTNVTKKKVDQWCQDEEFAAMLNEVDEIRDELIEEAFDNTSINKENPYTLGRAMTARFGHKGYKEQKTIDVNVKVEHQYLDPTDCLDKLCHNCQVNFLKAIEEVDQKNAAMKEQLLLPKPKVIEAEYTERPKE